MRLTLYEALSLRRVRQWEHERHAGLQRRLFDLTARPIEAVVNSIGPSTMHAAERAVGSTVETLRHASTYAVSPRALIRRARAHGVMIEDISQLKRCELKLLDQCNRKHINFHRRAATVQGAVLGLGGALAAVADLTALLVMDFKLIQEVAFCYGYDPNDATEKEIILQVILAALGSSEVKRACLAEIRQLAGRQQRPPDELAADEVAAELATDELATDELATDEVAADELAPPRKVSVVGSRAAEKYVEHLTVCLLVRAVPHLLPLLSVVTAARSNREMMAASGRTAFMVYRGRFVERKQQL